MATVILAPPNPLPVSSLGEDCADGELAGKVLDEVLSLNEPAAGDEEEEGEENGVPASNETLTQVHHLLVFPWAMEQGHMTANTLLDVCESDDLDEECIKVSDLLLKPKASKSNQKKNSKSDGCL